MEDFSVKFSHKFYQDFSQILKFNDISHKFQFLLRFLTTSIKISHKFYQDFSQILLRFLMNSNFYIRQQLVWGKNEVEFQC